VGVSRLLSFGAESKIDSDNSDSAPPSESFEVIARGIQRSRCCVIATVVLCWNLEAWFS
jgi:hypothetical protein